ncbi:NAD(P)/FAD-dependent oxidoreductase [Paracoccus aestuariivivens]|nr:NAD(P)/FAD-dependent oxidoreductase [Paracoccus aestuariivivens]
MTAAADLADRYDIVVIGAGPAGMAAATEAASHDVRVLLCDENPAPGGQIYRAITRNRPVAFKLLGASYAEGLPLVQRFLDCRADYAAGATVWSLQGAHPESEPEIGLTLGGSARRIRAGRVILATGATERPMPVPGWTLPGVMMAGAAQIALKSASAVPQGRIVLAGCGPLLYLLANQLSDAGAHIVALLDTSDRRQRWAAIQHLPSFAASPYLRKGLSLLVSAYRRIKVIGGVQDIAVSGQDRAEKVRFSTRKKQHVIEADTVLLHQGVIPAINLTSAAGCELVWDDAQHCFRPVVDGVGRTSVPGIICAGDGAGIGGARHAAVAGRIAAMTATTDLRIGTDPDCARQLSALQRRARYLLRGRRFLDLLYHPAPQFRAPRDPDTIVCRCEEIRAGTLRQAVGLGVPGPNQLKTFLRCGMGPCQGRMCAPTVTEIMAEMQGKSPAEVGTYRLRAPVKPLRLAELAAMPHTPAAIQAVAGHAPSDFQPNRKESP